MPFLDMSDVLLDPDFIDNMTVTRNTQSVDQNGNASDSSVTWNFYGTVTSKGGKRLNRNSVGQFESQTIFVVTLFPLTTGTNMTGVTIDADVVTWNGLTYTVTSIDDYSRYGAGFIQATCELITLGG